MRWMQEYYSNSDKNVVHTPSNKTVTSDQHADMHMAVNNTFSALELWLWAWPNKKFLRNLKMILETN